MRTTTDPAELCRLFAAAAQEYSQRQLSYQEDMVNAFFGLSVPFDQLLESGSIFGCPYSMLLNTLTWCDLRVNTSQTALPKRRMATKQPDIAVLPSWAWASYNGPIKLTAIPYTFPQSVCRFYGLQTVSNDLPRFSFPEAGTNKGLPCACNLTEHKIKMMRNQHLLVKTRIVTVSILAEGDEKLIPGQADLFTTEGQDLGPCDFRGQTTLDKLDGSEVTLMQLYARQNKGKPGSACVLVLKACRWLDRVTAASDYEPQKHCLEGHTNDSTAYEVLRDAIPDMLDPAKFIPQLAIEPPNPSTHKTFQESLSTTGCPEALIIGEDNVPEPEDVLYATRLGIAYVKVEQWIDMKPKSSLVFLG